MIGMGWSIGKGKRSPDVLTGLLAAADPLDFTDRRDLGLRMAWPDPPPPTIPSEGDAGLAGLLFTGRYALAPMMGWHCDHIADSRGVGMEGFPDWILIREVVIFVELKRERDRLRGEQTAYAVRLMRAGAWYELWRPGDWQRIGEILKTGQRPLIDGR